jgi:hypothetical protein
MIFSEMYNEAYRLNRDTAKTKFDLTTVKRWINQGEQRYCVLTNYSIKKDVSISTVASQQEYTLPTDCKSVKAVFYDGSRLAREEIENTVYSTTNSGTPSEYYIRLNKVGLDPIPTAVKTLTIIYHTIGGDLINDNDTPIIPEEDHNLPVLWAAYYMAIEADDNRANAFLQAYYEGVKQAVIANSMKSFESFPVVGEFSLGETDAD